MSWSDSGGWCLVVRFRGLLQVCRFSLQLCDGKIRSEASDRTRFNCRGVKEEQGRGEAAQNLSPLVALKFLGTGELKVSRSRGAGEHRILNTTAGHRTSSRREKLCFQTPRNTGEMKRMFREAKLGVSGEMTEAEAYEYEVKWFSERLEDPSLLASALQIEGLLAVPVGGKRRGGYLSLVDAEMCHRAIDRLTGRDGFPNLRYDYEQDDEGVEYHLVRWGDRILIAPDVDAPDAAWAAFETAEGRFYGYSEAAIGSYLKARS